MVVATYYINEYCGTDDPAILKLLNDPRPEHAAVEELARKSADYETAYRTVTAWPRMSGIQQKLLLVGTGGSLFTALGVAASSKTFFRKFAATSRISAPYDHEPPGLDGDVRNLVIMPQGWICIIVHYASYCVFYAWSLSVGASARECMASTAGAGYASSEPVSPAAENESSTAAEPTKNGGPADS
jgi:hypothetical protein